MASKDYTLKTCPDCNLTKERSFFNKSKARKSGISSVCSKCNSIRCRAYRAKNIDRLRAYDRNRGEHRTPEVLDRYRKKNKERIKTRSIFNHAVELGRLTRAETCEGCDSYGKIEGHHEDYSKPFDVLWLCNGCHNFVHVMDKFKLEIK